MTTTTKPEPPELPQFVSMRDVRRALGNASVSTIHGLIADGMLPAPIRPRHNWVLFPRAAVLDAFRRLGAAA